MFDLKTWLGLAVVGTFVSTAGALIGIVLKEYLFSRSFERWKQRQTLELLYQKYRDPLVLSGCELASRALEIVEHYPTVYLAGAVLDSRPDKQIENSTDDAYFRRYKLLSTVYRFSAFLGWLELCRQELTYLHPRNSEPFRHLERAIEFIREDFADGQLNQSKDWSRWRDTLIFREELRAIGESMIESRGTARTILGYARFAELFDAEAAASSTKRWAAVLLNFLLDLEEKRPDFRLTRLKRLLVHLVDVVVLLDEHSVPKYLLEARTKYASDSLQDRPNG
jgi:hypothetical protein